jgi:hypothetical protein
MKVEGTLIFLRGLRRRAYVGLNILHVINYSTSIVRFTSFRGTRRTTRCNGEPKVKHLRQTTTSNQGEILINATEDKRVPPFLDIPSESGMDISFFIGAAIAEIQFGTWEHMLPPLGKLF